MASLPVKCAAEPHPRCRLVADARVYGCKLLAPFYGRSRTLLLTRQPGRAFRHAACFHRLMSAQVRTRRYPRELVWAPHREIAAFHPMAPGARRAMSSNSNPVGPVHSQPWPYQRRNNRSLYHDQPANEARRHAGILEELGHRAGQHKAMETKSRPARVLAVFVNDQTLCGV